MKTLLKSSKPVNMKSKIDWSAFIAVLVLFGFSCEKETTSITSPTIMHGVCLVPGLTGAADSQERKDIFELSGKFPLTSPLSRKVTLEEFKAVNGEMALTVLEDGFQMRLKLSQLIPNGVYSLWIKTLGKASAEDGIGADSLTGKGVLGSRDGTQSAFVANSDGTASIEVFTPSGDLSMFGKIDSRTILEGSKLFVVGVYHLDNKPSGPVLLADGSAVEQFGFPFLDPDSGDVTD